MVMDTIAERFVEQTPITIMARLALQRALDPAGGDAVFEKHRQYQYQGELLFSSTVFKGCRVRIINGNHLPASEKRLKPLRAFRGASLPGQSLMVYDPATEIVTDISPCEDGHANERSFTAPILAHAQAGELWIADRNFSTRENLAGWHLKPACAGRCDISQSMSVSLICRLLMDVFS